MKTAVVSSAEVLQQETLAASHWCERLEGESYRDFKRRRAAEELERRATVHEAAARKLRQRARELRGITQGR